MSDKLKPCPFCGGESTVYPFDKNFRVGCSDHRCKVMPLLLLEWESEAEAIEAWNTRPFEAHAVEVLADIIFQRKKILRFSMEQARAEAMQLLGVKDGEL